MAPARLILPYVQDLPIELTYPTGTIWSGEARVHLQSQPLGKLIWTTSPFALILGEAEVDAYLQGKNLNLTAESVLATDGQQHHLNGDASLDLLNSRLVQYEIQLSGDISLKQVEIHTNENQKIKSVQGDIHWSGGSSRFRLLGALHQLELNPLNGKLSSESHVVKLEVSDPRANTQVLDATLETNSGWLHLTIYAPFLEYIGVPPIRALRNSAFIFQISEKIY